MDTVKVEVTVADGKISKVEVVEHNETEGFCEPAIEQIPGAIVEKKFNRGRYSFRSNCYK